MEYENNIIVVNCLFGNIFYFKTGTTDLQCYFISAWGLYICNSSNAVGTVFVYSGR